MTAVLLTIHSIIVLALIGVVLLQRSDGGALGIGGGGGGGGGFMSGRGAANALTRTTSVLAALFFATSLALAVRAGGGENTDTVIDELTGTQTAPAQTQQLGDDEAPSATDLLNSLGGEENTGEADSDEAASAAELIESLGAEAPPESAPVETQEETPADDASEEPAAGDVAPQSENETPNR
jgi:preprotein translocase subunit SecG